MLTGHIHVLILPFGGFRIKQDGNHIKYKT
jgi:hypothetical protein